MPAAGGGGLCGRRLRAEKPRRCLDALHDVQRHARPACRSSGVVELRLQLRLWARAASDSSAPASSSADCLHRRGVGGERRRGGRRGVARTGSLLEIDRRRPQAARSVLQRQVEVLRSAPVAPAASQQPASRQIARRARILHARPFGRHQPSKLGMPIGRLDRSYGCRRWRSTRPTTVVHLPLDYSRCEKWTAERRTRVQFRVRTSSSLGVLESPNYISFT